MHPFTLHDLCCVKLTSIWWQIWIWLEIHTITMKNTSICMIPSQKPYFPVISRFRKSKCENGIDCHQVTFILRKQMRCRPCRFTLRIKFGIRSRAFKVNWQCNLTFNFQRNFVLVETKLDFLF